MYKIEDRIKSLEVSRDVQRGKLKNLFDDVGYIEEQMLVDSKDIQNLTKKVNKLINKVDNYLDNMLAIENQISMLKKDNHCHKVIL